MDILEKLYELKDEEYAEFQSKLTPGIDRSLFIGVRIPKARKLAKELIKDKDTSKFLDDLPHRYYDENLLHGLILSEFKDYNECIERLDQFLPYVDNWAVCDTMSPVSFKKNKDKLSSKIYEWTSSDKLYTKRFGLVMIMKHFLDKDFKREFLDIPAGIHSDEYYLNMASAWFYATALAKRWNETIPYLKENRLDKWVHNKTIQKARESYRITKEQKEYLNTLKIK